jgi:DNA-binding response OmpR family regulator
MTTILVVEDETSLRETLAYNLTRQDYTVEAVADGNAAIEAARRLKPDLVVLDLVTGVQTCALPISRNPGL